MSENPSAAGHDDSTPEVPVTQEHSTADSQEHPTTELPRATEPTQALPSHPTDPAMAPTQGGSSSEPRYGVRAPQPAPDQPGGQPQYGGQQPPQPGYAPGTPQSQAPHFYGHQSVYGQHGTPQQPYQPGQPKTARKVGVGTLVAAVLAAGLIGGGVSLGANALLNPAQQTSSSQPNSSGQSGIVINNKDSVTAITAAAAKAAPSVVTIAASGGSASGTGSGIVIDDQGHILTNTHVVTLDGATGTANIQVRTSSGKVLAGKVVGTDPLSDLAVVKVDPSGLTPATLGNSSKLNVGDTAIAIGSPLGLTNTVTDGIVSTTNRTISVQSSAVPSDGGGNSGKDNGGYNFAPPNGQNKSSSSGGSVYLNVIQTDAAINPGNSGGALVNGQGEVVGVNVAIATAGSGGSGDSSGSGNIGVGFSIPIDYAKRIAQDIIKDGKATHGQLGTTVQSQPAGSGTSGSNGGSSAFSVGGLVVDVASGSAAEKAGIKKGDVITQLADYPISDSKELTAAVRQQAAGSTVTVKLLRNGKSMDVQVTLGAATQ